MLPLSDRFKNGHGGSTSTTYPIVIIGEDSDDNPICLSRLPQSLYIGGQSVYFEDWNLEVSSINEDLNISNRTFLTNDVDISVSNYIIKNQRFTDRFSGEFSGLKCRIYYANQGCKYLSDCPLVFEGFIRDYNVDSEKCQFTVEDESQYLRESNSFPKRRTPNMDAETIDTNKYLYFPVVYGENERSRLLFSRPAINNVISKIFADANYEDTGINIIGFQDTDSPLKILRDGMYLTVPRMFQEVPEDLVINGFNYYNYYANNTEQYEIIDQQIVLEKKISDHAFTRGMPLNIQARDQFQIDVGRTATGVRASSTDQVLTYGSVTDTSTGDIQEIEYQGHLNGYDVSSGGNQFSFPIPETDLVTYVGYYENQVMWGLLRRLKEVGYWHGLINGFDGYHDSGEFYIYNYWLLRSEIYETDATSPETAGACDFMRQLPQTPDFIKEYLDLPDGNDEWQCEWIVDYVTYSHIEYSKRWFSDGATHTAGTLDAIIYPSNSLVDGAITPSIMGGASAVHPIMKSSLDDDDDFRNQIGGQKYDRYMGVRFYRSGYSDIRILMDDPIDYDAEQQALEDLWVSKFPGYDPDPDSYFDIIVGGNVYDVLSNVQAIAFTYEQTNVSSPDYARYTEPLEPYIKTIPAGVNSTGEEYPAFSAMEWLKDDNGAWEETPTLRKLLYGRRVKPSENIETGIPLGTWVYGILPTLGYCKPKTHSAQSTEDSTGWNVKYTVIQDALYCIGNPIKKGENLGVEGFPVHANLFNNPAYIQSWNYQVWKYYDDGANLGDLKIWRQPSVPNDGNSTMAGYRPGRHYNWGSDFGPVIKTVFYNHTGNNSNHHSRPLYIGNDAVMGGSYVPVGYSIGQKKAIKLDITFNSLSGNDVVQGGTYSRFKCGLWMQYFQDGVLYPDSGNVDLLVECDAFQNDEGKNNLIEVKDINTYAITSVDENQYLEDGETINPNYLHPTESFMFTTGNPNQQPVDENGEPDNSLGAFSSGTELGIDPENSHIVFSECDAFKNEENPEDDTWRQDINSINNISLTYHIGLDPKETDYDDDGNFTPNPINQNIDANIRTLIHTAELHQRFIVGNVSQQEYFGHVKGRIDDYILEEGLGSEWDEQGNLVFNVRGRYSGKILDLNNITDNWMLTNPADIICHLINKEFSYTLNSINSDSIEEARQAHNNWQFNFTISEETDPMEFLEEYSQSTMFCPRMRYDGSFDLINLHKTIDSADRVIHSEDIISYNYTQTQASDLYLKVRVAYGYDEGLDTFSKATNLDNGGAVPSNYQDYLDHYNVSNLDHNYLDFESKFITDETTAKSLRNLLLSYYKNRHNIIMCELPHTYLNLECGDIVAFDNLIDGVSMFGIDYTQDNEINGQIITKYFLVSGVTKKENGVSLTLIQHHLYDENYIENDPTIDFLYNLEDIIQLDPVGVCQVPAQLYDPNANAEDYVEIPNLITQQQCELISEDHIWTVDAESVVVDEESAYLQGDSSLDGLVNILDVVLIVGYITGMNDLFEESLTNADWDLSGQVDVLDLVSMIDAIINEEV